MQALEALIPGLVGLLMPAAQSALGVGASVDAQHAWVKEAIQDLFQHVLFSRVGVPSWAASLEQPIEDLVSAELAKLLAKVEK